MKRWACLAIFCLAGARPARGQLPYQPSFEAGQRALSLNLGIAQPTGTSGLAAVASRGPSLGLEFLKYSSDWLAWGAALDMHQLGKGSDPGPPSLTGTASFKALSLLARVNFIRGESWTPYALGGLGYGTAEVSTMATAAPGAVVCAGGGNPCAATAGVTQSNTGPVVTAAFGLESFVAKGLSICVEGRYQEYRLPNSSASFPVPAKRAEAIAARLGIRLWFGASS